MRRRESIKPLQNVGRVIRAYLEPDEIAYLEKCTTNLRDRLLIRLLFHLGCRISEALGLEVKDIDFTQGIVNIEHLKSRIKLACPKCSAHLGKRHTYCPRCGVKVEEAVAKEQEHRRIRTLPLDQNTLEMLKDYIKRGGPVTRNGKELLFGINRHRAWQIVGACAERAGLPKLVNTETGKVHNISPHRLRDAFAVHAVKLDDSGDGLRMLQEHLGHQSFNTTAKYRKVSGKEHRDWYQKLWSEDVNS
jgi:integrase/recombinase XerD